MQCIFLITVIIFQALKLNISTKMNYDKSTIIKALIALFYGFGKKEALSFRSASFLILSF